MTIARLRLVVEEKGAHDAPDSQGNAERNGPVERVFDQWVFMLDKRPGRTVLGPDRRRVIERALGMYEENVLMLAIEGCAGSAWHAGANDRGEPYQDLTLILRNERNIERFAEMGDAMRESFEREQRRKRAEQAQAAVEESTPDSRARAQQARQHLRDFLAAKRRMP